MDKGRSMARTVLSQAVCVATRFASAAMSGISGKRGFRRRPDHLCSPHLMTPESIMAAAANGADPNHDFGGDTPLSILLSHCHTPFQMAALMVSGADPNLSVGSHRHPLLEAVTRHWVPDGSVCELIRAGASVHTSKTDGNTVLHLAAASGNLSRSKACSLVFSGGARPDEANIQGQTPLHLAASALSRSGTESLLGLGADPNARDSSGKTPLHLAVSWRGDMPSAMPTIESLVSAGADPNAKDSFGESPLSHLMSFNSSGRGMVAAASFLLSSGASPNSRDSFDDTPLHSLLRRGDSTEFLVDIVSMCVEAGFRQNQANGSGDSVSHLLAQIIGETPEELSIPSKLFAMGFRFDIPNASGNTPAGIARSLGKGALCDSIMECGASEEFETLISEVGRCPGSETVRPPDSV